MMRNNLHCDACGKMFPTMVPDYRAAVGVEDDGEAVDLCSQCCCDVFALALREGFVDREKVQALIRKKCHIEVLHGEENKTLAEIPTAVQADCSGPSNDQPAGEPEVHDARAALLA